MCAAGNLHGIIRILSLRRAKNRLDWTLAQVVEPVHQVCLRAWSALERREWIATGRKRRSRLRLHRRLHAAV